MLDLCICKHLDKIDYNFYSIQTWKKKTNPNVTNKRRGVYAIKTMFSKPKLKALPTARFSETIPICYVYIYDFTFSSLDLFTLINSCFSLTD